ncbi:PREDICTED: serine/threonine-protein kinase mph1 isoform X1 [Nicotiana attenuata]|uniref:Cell division control protein 2-like protein n=1 Tax=Nicotiana attenuata TaxID=49451 RepID=A0A314KJB2_NICAT|nr:PREDICTED: serine/threonine-protein kinase mph1 isoform X1 [Nicotiana attenuata]OIT28864.1 cell division control protein 2-like protein [Nicotiana attenuata]
MESETANLLERQPATAGTKPISIRPSESANVSRSFTTATLSSSSSSQSDLIRHIQAIKRPRPLGTMQSNVLMPRRSVAPQRGASKGSTLNRDCALDTKKTQDEISLSHRLMECISQPKNIGSVNVEAQEDAMPPSEYGSTVDAHEENYNSFNSLRDQPRSFTGRRSNITAASSVTECEHILLAEGQKRVHFAADSSSKSQEMDWDVGNQMEAVTAASQVLRDQNIQSTDVDGNGNSSLLANRTLGAADQIHQFRNFLRSDLSHPMTQASVVGSSCTTTTLINSTSAPMLNSTTYCSQPHLTSNSMESLGEPKLKSEHQMQPSYPFPKHENRFSVDQTAVAVASSTNETDSESKRPNLAEGQKSSMPITGDMPKDTSPLEDNSAKECVTDIQSEAPLSKVSSSNVKLEPSKSKKEEKSIGSKAPSSSRKKSYDPDTFFKVNGKHYQRLGKIGSGGSSEVHKVIASDCSIYALKKIKLKGRDYATSYGFCQEIEYLKRLKGKNNIIQLIDYEVTDKRLLDEVMNGSMSNNESRVKEDGYIYMVLEYGEIDLAHMLSQKWKELDDPDSIIDENWLRFYWQQILLAVNTIHEERIVHSDLKPANFLLVRGSLKLIDFGIAKAIMSDTTNIQRDSQVGTLSYMSPEAFMCNETDANGNTIKCGRPSDIWSLGCILYQMVYGRTPFAEYKTFWAKFKVITDPNHEITYEPLSNPWLLDLMKKCLAWDRNERWRIPQLLQHPFLVPPVPPQLLAPPEQSCTLLQLIAKSCENDGKASMLCMQLQNLLVHPSQISHEALPVCQYQKLLCDVSALCLQLQKQLGNTESGTKM